jgi:hypothetical protein
MAFRRDGYEMSRTLKHLFFEHNIVDLFENMEELIDDMEDVEDDEYVEAFDDLEVYDEEESDDFPEYETNERYAS